ncbi:MAG: hypothetical protein ACFE9L_07525 [Candidatus Hodarchaeota archaeon]
MRWIKKLNESLDQYVGEIVKEKIMKGCEKINSRSSGGKRARWIKNAMDQLDELVDEKTRKEVLMS